MKTFLHSKLFNRSKDFHQPFSIAPATGTGWRSVLLICAFTGFVCGCQTSDQNAKSVRPTGMMHQKQETDAARTLTLSEGDVIRVTFPSAENMNTLQPIRRDGKITLQMVGEISAAGKTPKELEAELIKIYEPQLQSKEVMVSVEKSSFPVFLTGAVIKPGKIMADRPLTALEAIMEAGGFDYSKANTKEVMVIRHTQGEVKNFRLNLKDALRGKVTNPFNVQPGDIIYVPEKFTWF